MDKLVQWFNDITSSKVDYTIQVRVIRLYKNSRKDDPSQYSSTKNDKIHGIIKESYMTTFFSNMKEGNCYTVSNFGLALYDAKIKHCSHKYKIIFARNTTISSSPSLSVPMHGFNFTEFEKILVNTLDKNFHYDVIRLFVGIDSTISTFKKLKGIQGKRITFRLMDIRYFSLFIYILSQYFIIFHSLYSLFV
ncbi:hypothetical protein V2J09_010485 [Rumex salicifolius]